MARIICRISLTALIVCVVLALGSICFAEDLNKSIASATTVVIGRLDEYVAEPEEIDNQADAQARGQGFVISKANGVVANTREVPGRYSFTVQSRLKGRCPEKITVQLPRILAWYTKLGSPEPLIEVNRNHLLLLTGSEDKGFEPVDAKLPLMPLSDKAQLPAEAVGDKPGEVLSAVIRLLGDSLADPKMRSTDAYALREAQSDQAVKAMRPYLDDADENVHESVLVCLATNQDVTAIPRIAALADSEGHWGLPFALTKYRTLQAVANLNPLLIEPKFELTRVMAANTLLQLPPDKSSTPYWLRVLRDPQLVPIDPYSVYRRMRILMPSLGPVKPASYFRDHREEEIRLMETWWADEVAGKHNK